MMLLLGIKAVKSAAHALFFDFFNLDDVVGGLEDLAKENLTMEAIFDKNARKRHKAHRDNAQALRSLINKYKARHGALIGSSANDGLITEESQARTICQIGGTPISANYITRVGNACQDGIPALSELKMKEIRGDGEGFRKPVGKAINGVTGIIPLWYEALVKNNILTPREMLQAKANISNF